ncbi:MAG: mannose-1-phosphate guanylyltransferase/mannose-6-phosphate isomerase [Synergistaceae bacterium]|jgi:mannose-1-phosphate guanylyltransferase/mannose-6-phosphate isomerase|nr:mannose-1-phosphate guanylyltransferase/mannose-6-phosphate isomerase [Synergistaceae bacterium]
MMDKPLHVLILAGGSGTRLWPLSREEMPKQFLSVCGDSLTLLQRTASRMTAMTAPERLRVVASGRWKPLINHQLAGIGLKGSVVIEEPEGKNTAPAIALGVARIVLEGAGDDDLVLVCPSDHIIRDEAEFFRAAEMAAAAASEGSLVTFGIKPTSPETGFGYIKTFKTSRPWLDVDMFVEKPDENTARGYLESGDYYWNGGIFCFKISDIISAFNDYFPEIAPIFKAGREEMSRWFLASPPQSIDYAIMEKARNIACVPLDAGWSDVGSWDAVYDNSQRDESENATVGNVRLQGGRNNLVVGYDRLICGVDLDSMIVIDTPDAIFVSPRGSSQKLRNVVRDLSEAHYEEVSEAPVSARQWGVYNILSKGPRQKIKRLEVSPGKSLSLQYHMHRSEHWVVVSGTARVTVHAIGDADTAKPRLVHEGESVFVPKGYVHRLENPGKVPLEIIEVQIGEYVGEDDIVRTAD